jgi:23S rRNA pseudouridine1911/1915/1917 synthase
VRNNRKIGQTENRKLKTENFSIEEEPEELFEHYHFVVDKGQSLLRIDKFLSNRIENISRNKIQNAAAAESILVNGKPVKSSHKVKPNDVISIVLSFPPREIEIIPQNIPINIVYEDDDIIIVNKDAGMVVHPAYGNYSGTLVNALTYHLKDLMQSENSEIRPLLAHRLDKDTSGIMVVAKNEFALSKLSKDFFNRNIEKKYFALAWGDFKENEGTITGHIGRNLKNRKVMDVFPEGDYGKPSVTHYKVLERFYYVTLLECILETGRTHQIRAHFKYIGHPLFNDKDYGGNKIIKGTTFSKYKQFVENCFEILPRQALHAKELGFTHPRSKEKLLFTSDLPDDMKTVLEKWKKYSEEKS